MIRTRFAVSPTGYMHIGGVRTALFSYLTAKKAGGEFILRIEDTDRARFVADAEAHIHESLDWLGLKIDEGPRAGGDYGPYRQSERLDLYLDYAKRLIESGKAYADPTTPEELAEWRQQAAAAKQPFHFNQHRPADPPQWQEGLPIRLKIDAEQSPEWSDLVRGQQAASRENIDDFVLIKADGYPTYNFAHIIDDHEMKITHVIRGDEFISSMPKFLLLYAALDFELPQFAHLPPIMAPEGNKKLSKRDGAPDLLQYRDRGFLPEAVANFLALMGWNDGTEQEIYRFDELIEKFELSRVQRSGARYDEARLEWINWQHTKALIETDFERLLEHLGQDFDQNDQSYLHRAAKLASTKANNLELFKDQLAIFTTEPEFKLASADLAKIDKSLNQEVASRFVNAAIDSLEGLEAFEPPAIEAGLRSQMEALDAKPRAFLNLIRWVISGRAVSPGLFEMIELLGKERTLGRLQAVVDR